MGSPPKSVYVAKASFAHLVGLLFHHVRSAIDILEQITREELVETVVSTPLASRSEAIAGIDLAVDKRSYTIKEVASAIGVGRSTIYAAITKKNLKAVKLGSRTLILRDDLQSWIASFPSR